MLNDIYNAYKDDNNLEHLLLNEQVQQSIKASVPAARTLITSAMNAGIAVPCYAAAITYFDSFRSGRMPSNLTQAQRDYFGAHTYQLIGKEGVFHTEWKPDQHN